MGHFHMGYTAEQLFEMAQESRRNRRFGDAINLFRAASAAPDATEDIRRTCLASIDLIQEINGFVNTDLMNP
ncbi:MAG: hypothetical protein IJE61_01970 [Bacteroidales bacterium]|nr:hypothetical protein [Bacteroidales bacterium]